MRKFFITLALFTLSIVGNAQSIDDILEQFKNEKNVTLLDMPRSLIATGIASKGRKTAGKWVENIDRLRVLSLEKANNDAYHKFITIFKKLDLLGYNDMIKVTSSSDKVRILTREENKKITSLIICAADAEGGDCALVVIDGHINPDNVDSIVNIVNQVKE